MRVAIYARVSTDGQSVNAQLADLREVADRRGWEIVHEYTDKGISGAKGRDQRPASIELKDLKITPPERKRPKPRAEKEKEQGEVVTSAEKSKQEIIDSPGHVVQQLPEQEEVAEYESGEEKQEQEIIQTNQDPI